MSELRRDPILGRWVIISSDRAGRPLDFRPARETWTGGGFCPFCAGNEYTTPSELLAYRPDGSPPDSPGWDLRVVPNKFPALRREGEPEQSGEILYQTMSGIGAHEVIIEAPGHDQTLASLPADSVERVLKAYASRLLDLKKDPRLEYVIVFKNHGPSAGATLEHTHSQLIALPIVPTRVLAEMEGALSHRQSTGECIFCDIIHRELRHGARIVADNEHFTVLCPFASPYAFETWILPKKHTPRFESSAEHFPALAAILSDLLRRINAVLGKPDYNFVIHTAPLHENNVDHYHWHLELIPKLNRVAGFEWGSSFFINPTPPEEAASFLREAGQEG